MAIIVKIMGGLGNQMFQYAAGRALALRLNEELKLDYSWFTSVGSDTYRIPMLDIFPIEAKYANAEEVNRVIYKRQNIYQKMKGKKQYTSSYIAEPSYEYWSGFTALTSPAYLLGYWQNEKYFSSVSAIIRQDFLFPEFSCSDAKSMAAKIEASPCPVCIHIRRGDYVENPVTNQYHGVCPLEYYEKAIQIIVDKNSVSPELFLFSDDPVWVRNNFKTLGCFFEIMDIMQHKNMPYHDMHLMSLCKHHIIANSSFSWWGAWLSGGDGIVIAPKRWFTEKNVRQYTPSVASWMEI